MVKLFPSPCGNKIQIKCAYAKKDMVKSLPGRTWNASAKVWEVPVENFESVLKKFPGAMVHPEVHRIFEEVRLQIEKALEIKELTDADRRVPGLKGELYPYQAVGKEFLGVLRDGEGAVLGFDMGLGKTICAIASFLDLYNAGEAKRCLVVCPASLKYSTWEKEIKKWTDLSYIVIDGDPYSPEDREVLIDYEEEDWVYNPDGTRKFEMEPVYGSWETVDLKMPIPFMSLTGDFEKEILPRLPKSYSMRDLPGDVVVEDGMVVAVKMKPYLRDKKTFLKKKTGVVSEKVVRMSGKDLRRVQYQQDDRVFMIVNYELFLHDTDIIPKIDDNWVIILDECHRIKSTKAKTSKNLLKHCEGAKRKFLLSGTPLENNIAELWNIVDFARSGLLGTFYKYKERYILMDPYGNMIAPKPQLLPELKQKIAPIILRRRKEEVLPDLPPLVELPYWVDMLPEQKALYTEVREGILANQNGEVDYMTVLAQLTRFQQILDSPALLADLLPDRELTEDSGKLQELWNILEDINVMENKVIVFSQYRSMTDILYRHISQKYGVGAVRYISGQTNNQLRGVYQHDFQNDERVRIIIITTAGNYGLDLYKASYVICYDQLFNPQKMNQVISRAHRNGAEQKVTAIHLLTRDSYEERKIRLLEEKKEVFGAVIDDDLDYMKSILTKAELKELI